MRTFCLMMVTIIAFLPGRVLAQDMEPRAYSNAPVGMNFLVMTYGRSIGNVIVDSTLPIEDSDRSDEWRTMKVFSFQLSGLDGRLKTKN